jgi:apolipoprotein D and lipocalin family protein
VRGLRGRAAPPLATVGALDLQRYAGLWHEIARLPRRAERRCERDVLAFYRPHAEGLIAVNACTDRSGRRHEKAALLRVPDAREPGRLEASFAPPWLRWLPAAWTDYCVMYVDPDYEVALVGTPERDGLWLLARDPVLPDNVRQGLLELAARHGFDTSRVRATPQEGA